MAVIEFKSTPENYYKEKVGVKKNTLRKREEGETRFRILDMFISKELCNLRIDIRHPNGDMFSREVSDVILWDGYYIISWQ